MDHPQITPGSNGYLAPIQGSTATNPWAIDDTSQAISQGNQNLAQMQTGIQNYAQSSAPYPTFQNSAGIGSQSAFSGPPPTSQPALQVDASNQGSSSVAAQQPYMGSTGFNPWSLKGEALSR